MTEVITYEEVMVLNLSCPAVSHICSFTLSPSISILRILKSIPIVAAPNVEVPMNFKREEEKENAFNSGSVSL